MKESQVYKNIIIIKDGNIFTLPSPYEFRDFKIRLKYRLLIASLIKEKKLKEFLWFLFKNRVFSKQRDLNHCFLMQLTRFSHPFEIYMDDRFLSFAYEFEHDEPKRLYQKMLRSFGFLRPYESFEISGDDRDRRFIKNGKQTYLVCLFNIDKLPNDYSETINLDEEKRKKTLNFNRAFTYSSLYGTQNNFWTFKNIYNSF